MYITVRLLNGFKKPLTYKLPQMYSDRDLQGKVVEIPLRTYTTYGLVTHQFSSFAHKPAFEIREISSLKEFPEDAHYFSYIEKIAAYYQLEPFMLLRRLQSFLSSTKKDTLQPLQNSKQQTSSIKLTGEQQVAVDAISPAITNATYMPTVLHGVTGSGKTEIYKKLMEQAFKGNKTTVILLPEVTLALRFEQLFRESLEHIPLYSFHSGNTSKEKRLLWQALLKKEACILIGVHLPMLLPISNLGLIIIDEEHETGYQEKKHPKLNSKECALIRAHHYKLPIILGSATPSISSLHNVQKRKWHFFQLKKRFSGAFPKISVVLLAEKKSQRRNFWISKELENAIKDRLQKKEQTIVFLNRRGYSFFIQCKQCAHIPYCPNCSVSMTPHNNNTLHCHYCNTTQPVPEKCPACKHDKLLKKGIGTQQVVTILEKLFPHAVIARADLDTTSKKKMWQQTMRNFQDGTIDILVGTQTITKGYHFPRVTLVGILWADLNLHFPIFNAAETTLQQLIQVAGRAGREHKESHVIVQTMSDHEIFSYLCEQHYLNFYQREAAKRQILSYPPHGRLIELELTHTQERIVEHESLYLMQLLKKQDESLTILGPSKPPTAKIKNYHRRTLYIKTQSIAHISLIYRNIPKEDFRSSLHYTPLS